MDFNVETLLRKTKDDIAKSLFIIIQIALVQVCTIFIIEVEVSTIFFFSFYFFFFLHESLCRLPSSPPKLRQCGFKEISAYTKAT